MKRVFLFVACLVVAATANADPDRGQQYYLKYLRPYFEYNGQVFAQQHLKIEWKRYFKNDAAKFIETYSEKHPNSAEFLHSDTFLKIAPHIQDFAVKYAADSGELPSCN